MKTCWVSLRLCHKVYVAPLHLNLGGEREGGGRRRGVRTETKHTAQAKDNPGAHAALPPSVPRANGAASRCTRRTHSDMEEKCAPSSGPRGGGSTRDERDVGKPALTCHFALDVFSIRVERGRGRVLERRPRPQSGPIFFRWTST